MQQEEESSAAEEFEEFRLEKKKEGQYKPNSESIWNVTRSGLLKSSLEGRG